MMLKFPFRIEPAFNTTGAMDMVRTILSIVGGYLVMAVLTAFTISLLAYLFPESYNPENTEWVVANILYGAAFAAIGGYVLALIARENVMRNVLILAAIMVVLGIATFVMTLTSAEATGQPIWYYPVLLLTSIPAMIFGAKIRSQQPYKLASSV
jgi:peptidoglycan/LPS O-acetylase OafA/YrhL